MTGRLRKGLEKFKFSREASKKGLAGLLGAKNAEGALKRFGDDLKGKMVTKEQIETSLMKHGIVKNKLQAEVLTKKMAKRGIFIGGGTIGVGYDNIYLTLEPSGKSREGKLVYSPTLVRKVYDTYGLAFKDKKKL